MKKKILIADDNLAFCSSLKDFISTHSDFDVVGIAANGVQALQLVESTDPDYLLLDIVMPELDGFGVLSALEGKRPIVIMISQLATDGFVQKAMQYGASYFLAKPLDFSRLLKLLMELGEPQPAMPKPAPTSKRVRSLDEKIANLFISVGIPAHIKGYQFLREAIKMTIDTPDIINSITKRLYPGIAERYDTSASKVERAIRHAIEVAWSRGKIENINNIFGIKIYSPNEKPTNGEFIALIADKLMLESA
ncbi:MAG: sporulation transcription factor Spo0A [Clostridiales bacterium]|nr:sporulation transcription factor Spo0A [Clostridiales bacterium]